MPTYDYGCRSCGTFSRIRPMSQRNTDQACPNCVMPSPRVIVAVPGFSTMKSSTRLAHATNERSAHAPQSSTARAYETHSPGCGCCRVGSTKTAQAGGKKGFPTERPWMISH
jgi:putative FmdB family regulatory protein